MRRHFLVLLENVAKPTSPEILEKWSVPLSEDVPFASSINNHVDIMNILFDPTETKYRVVSIMEISLRMYQSLNDEFIEYRYLTYLKQD